MDDEKGCGLMADFDIDKLLGPEDDEPIDGPKALRSAVKKLQRELADERAKTAAFEAAAKQSTLSDLLKSKGLPEKVAALYTGEPTEDGINAWLGEYGDVLGVKATDPEAGDGTQAPAGMTSGVDPAVVAAQRAQAAVTSGAQATTASHAAKTQIEGAGTKDELAKALALQGFTLT